MFDFSIDFSTILSFDNILAQLNLVQGVFFGIVLITLSSKKNKYYLGLFLFFWGISFTSGILSQQDFFAENIFLIFLPFNFYFLYFPLLYLYIKELTGTYDFEKDKKHLIPGLLEFVLFLGLFITFFDENYQLDQSTSYFISCYHIASILFGIYYLIKMLLLIRENKTKVLEVFSSTTNKLLQWLIPIIYIFLFSMGLGLTIILTLLYYPPEVDLNNVIFNLTFLISSILTTISTYWVILYGFKQSTIWPKALEKIPFEKNSSSIEGDIGLEFDTLFEKVLHTIENSKCYRNDELNIADLATLTGIHHLKQSKIIKHKTGMNFNSFINEFRIKEAKEILSHPTAFMEKRFTIDSLGSEVGFKTKTSFYKAFKQFEKTTPAQYFKNWQDNIS